MQARHAVLPGQHVQRHAIAAYGCGVDPGQGILHGEIVDKIAGLEVVGAVENKLCIFEQSLNVGWGQIGDMGLDHDFGVESRNFSGRGDCFRKGFSGIGFIKQGLPLQIAGLDVIAVNDADRAHARTGKQGSEHRASSAAADNGNARGGQLALTFQLRSREKALGANISRPVPKRSSVPRVQTIMIGATRFSKRKRR